jgi:nucleoside-diphosphate-sugar epimerase
MDVERFVLISTIDVYQPPVLVDETARPLLDGDETYGRHRAWFERFVMERFDSWTVVRLPGLFGPGLRKNLIFDLLEGRDDQYSRVNSKSRYQFWDVTETWPLVEEAARLGIDVLNVATEPVAAGDVAQRFGVALPETGPEVMYDVHTRYASELAGRDGPYIRSAEEQLAGIDRLRDSWIRS